MWKLRNKLDMLKLHWEQARCFWELKQPQEALTIAKAVVRDAKDIRLLDRDVFGLALLGLICRPSL